MFLNSKSQFSKFNCERKVFVLLTLLLIVYCSLLTTNAQKRDNLTNEEDLIVRDAQELDVRMQVFVKVIDRRLLALTDPNAGKSKQAQKDSGEWGELRMGSPTDLFFDIQKTLDEAILKIDDVAERDQKNPLFQKGVHVLADGCRRFIPQFQTFQEKATDRKEQGLISNSINSCSQIIEASARVPKEEKKKKN